MSRLIRKMSTVSRLRFFSFFVFNFGVNGFRISFSVASLPFLSGLPSSSARFRMFTILPRSSSLDFCLPAVSVSSLSSLGDSNSQSIVMACCGLSSITTCSTSAFSMSLFVNAPVY